MTDDEILARIHQLVDEEHSLRQPDQPVDEERRRRLEETLDQCWDLLRQRRAKREFGENPDDAEARDVNIVEGYQQ